MQGRLFSPNPECKHSHPAHLRNSVELLTPAGELALKNLQEEKATLKRKRLKDKRERKAKIKKQKKHLLRTSLPTTPPLDPAVTDACRVTPLATTARPPTALPTPAPAQRERPAWKKLQTAIKSHPFTVRPGQKPGPGPVNRPHRSDESFAPSVAAPLPTAPVATASPDEELALVATAEALSLENAQQVATGGITVSTVVDHIEEDSIPLITDDEKEDEQD